MVLPSTSRIGSVCLTVSDLDRAERFYVDVLGFTAAARSAATVSLAAPAAPMLLELTALPGARPKPARSTGLYHFAILLPSRLDLARSLRRLAEMRWPLQGVADHGVSEALYLADPDGNGIEIYRDRPREEWPQRNGQLQMVTDPLDVDGVIDEMAQDERPWQGLPAGACIGHVHLHVADLRQAERFYCDVLGFDVTQRYGPSALFVSASGYHHHVGLNTWAGVGAPPPPAGSAGLRYFDIQLPDRPALATAVERLVRANVAVAEQPDGWYVRDPSQNGIRLQALGYSGGDS